MSSLVDALFRPQPVALRRRQEQGQGAVHAGGDADRARRGLRGGGRRRHPAPVERAEAAHGGRARRQRLRDAGAADAARARAHGRARHLHRPRRAGAAVERLRQEAGRARAGDQHHRRHAGERRLAQAARRNPVRPDGPARRHQDQDRPMVDHRARAGGACRAGPRAAAQDPRLAAGVEAALDLHRGAAELRQSQTPAACTRPTRWRRPRPAGCRRPSRTCRTSRSAPRTAARSARPSSPRRA